jgi:hypothetical protein
VSYEEWQKQSARGSPHAKARKGRTRILATRQLHEPKIHPHAEESVDEKRTEGFHFPALSPCIAAVACVKGAKLTLLVPVKG